MWIKQKVMGGGRPPAIVAAGVDSGQLMIARYDVLDQIYDPESDSDSTTIEWPTLVLKDGRRFKAGGEDFFHWDAVLPSVGKSPNQLVQDGDAQILEPKGTRLGALNYSGACAASNSAAGFGYIGRGIEEAIVFHVRNDGFYPMLQAETIADRRKEPISSFGFVPFGGLANEREAIWITPVGRLRTMGMVGFCDPCSGSSAPVKVVADADGDSEVWGYYVPGRHGLCGFAIELSK